MESIYLIDLDRRQYLVLCRVDGVLQKQDFHI